MGKGSNVSHQMEYMLATGNLVSRTGLGLMQVRGQKIKQTYKYLCVYCEDTCTYLTVDICGNPELYAPTHTCWPTQNQHFPDSQPLVGQLSADMLCKTVGQLSAD